jgi:predicted NUDIX family phosphoesterase
MIPPSSQSIQSTPLAVPAESILVVKRSLLIDQPWHGLKEDGIQDYVQRIQKHQEFLPRAAMEEDPSYKQIIPYIIFQHEDRYFLMQRRSDASEKRLQNKFTLGIGGHVRQEDVYNADITAWAQREFTEEVHYSGTLEWQFLGLINDDSNLVGQVHLGLALLARGDSDDISIKSELKSGQLHTLEECAVYYDHLETWSQFVLDNLMNQHKCC